MKRSKEGIKKEFILLIDNPVHSNLTNILAPKNPTDSKIAFTVTTPLQKKTLHKYFKKAQDLEIIKDSLLEEPKLFEFDQVHSVENSEFFFQKLIESMQKNQELGINQFSPSRTDDLYVIFSTQK